MFDRQQLKQLLIGLRSRIHSPKPRPGSASGTGGATASARYCYSVWARHLVMAARHGLPTQPGVVAELGPGDSLGVGLAALISGTEQYYALDVVADAQPARNLAVFEELVLLFRARAAVPGDDELPQTRPRLPDYRFPEGVFTPARLAAGMQPARLDRIRASLREPGAAQAMLQYRVPWSDPAVVAPGTVDMVLSQAVLQHVDDLKGAYAAMGQWVRLGGLASHQINFGCHGLTSEWNGHWTCPSWRWRLMRGKRAYFINREPHSRHRRLLSEAGFDLVCDEASRSGTRITRRDLAAECRCLADEDLTTSGAFIQAVRKPAA